MRAIAIVAPALAIAIAACASLKDAEHDAPAPVGPEAGGAGDAATTEDGATGDAASESGPLDGGDPRWPSWPLPPDAPTSANYAVVSGADGALVTDRTTGLVWQDSVPSTKRDLAEAHAYCNDLVYDGLSNWRLPTRIEAISIMKFEPTLGGTELAAPGISAIVGADFEWTASTYPPAQDRGWSIGLANITLTQSSDRCVARCVRGAPLGASAPRVYDILDVDMLRDPFTGLLWERVPPDTGGTWTAADARCKALAHGGKTWRLPGVKELASIVDETRQEPASVPSLGDFSVTMFTANDRWKIHFDIGTTYQGPTGFDAWSRCVSGP